MDLIWAALVCWLVTMILCESELFRPTRELAKRLHWKLGYLHSCTLCLGTWVGMAVALAYPQVRPLGAGFLGWAGAALAIKALAHGAYVLQKLMEHAATHLKSSAEYTAYLSHQAESREIW